MTIQTIACTPFDDQKPGTSGLRKTTARFMVPHYLQSYIEALFSAVPPHRPLVVGGDGRFFNSEAIQSIIQIAAAHGCPRLIIGQNGVLSTPAASHLVRSRNAGGAIILSASHNPAGPDGDFGLKYNGDNGAPAPERVTESIYAAAKSVTAYRLQAGPAVDLGRLGVQHFGGAEIEIVDPTSAYADLMERLFDFDRIGDLVRRRDFRFLFDGMSAVTGPYAEEIFQRRLRAPAQSLIRCTTLPDFGGGHPDPTPANAKALWRALQGGGADFGAASDGDGDRHMILAPGFHVNPSDSLAIMTANAEQVPGYRGRLCGVARSMPTSRAVDVVAKALGVKLFETPTGWKFFGSLLDAGEIVLCGEESAGAGSDHVREKDGLWAVLYWLNLVAARGLSVRQIVDDHWRQFGRHACQRFDFDGLDTDQASSLMDALKAGLPALRGAACAGQAITTAKVFDYVDPITGDEATDQGVILELSSGGRIVYRLSGTGTSGATLRIYLEQVVSAPELFAHSAGDLVRDLGEAARALAQLEHFTGRTAPSATV